MVIRKIIQSFSMGVIVLKRGSIGEGLFFDEPTHPTQIRVWLHGRN
jgi:hypothetical protein